MRHLEGLSHSHSHSDHPAGPMLRWRPCRLLQGTRVRPQPRRGLPRTPAAGRPTGATLPQVTPPPLDYPLRQKISIRHDYKTNS